MDPSAYRIEPLLRRVDACLRALRAPDVATAQTLLEQQPALIHVATNAVLIGVTRFYRDQGVFEALRSRWLPELLQAKHDVSAWSVGCSDGSELYTLAALLAERDALATASLRGTDVRREAIQQARRGEYPLAAQRDLPEALQAYFTYDGTALRPADSLKSHPIEWEVEDAVACRSKTTWDLILCRNMAIYLEPNRQCELWARLAAALNPRGILVVGRAERPRSKELTRLDHCIYTRVSS